LPFELVLGEYVVIDAIDGTHSFAALAFGSVSMKSKSANDFFIISPFFCFARGEMGSGGSKTILRMIPSIFGRTLFYNWRPPDHEGYDTKKDPPRAVFCAADYSAD
jgi:hypothetical protein